MNRPALVMVLLPALSAAAAPAAAQGMQRSTIAGLVSDASGARVAGATVELTGARALGGLQTVATDALGRYRFTRLLPGVYAVSAAAPGLQRTTRRDIVLPVNTTYDVNFALGPATLAESIDVRGNEAPIDLRRSSSPTVFGAAALRDLPTERTLSSVLALTPGVVTTPPLFGVGGEVAFGGTQGSNGFTADGVDLTEPALGTPWSAIGYDWLEQVEVVALGAGAEYGGFTGAIANGVLRSGSNRVAGLVAGLFTRPSWSSDNLGGYPAGEPRPQASRTLLDWWDLGAQLGAPIVRDRLWVFTGATGAHHAYRPFGYTGPGETSERTTGTIVKVDAAVRPALALQGFWTREASDLIGSGLSRFRTDPVTSPDQFTRRHAWNARGTWTPRAALVLEARASGNTGDVDRVPHPPATLDGPPPGFVSDTNTACCNAPWSREFRRTTQVAGTIGAFADGPHGTHDVRLGVEVEWAPADSEYGRPGDRAVTYRQGAVVQFEEWAGDRLLSDNDRVSLFVQDRWALGARLTLEPGLRVEWRSGSVPSVPEVIATTALGPRLGAAWDLTGGGTTVVRAHYGRYFDRLFGHVFDAFEPGAFSPHVVYAVTPDGPVEVFRYSETVNAEVGADLEQPHVDQVVLGVERSLGAHTTVQAQYVGRRFGDFLGYVDRQLSSWTAHEVVDPGPDGVAGNADDAGPITVYRPYGSDFDSSGRDLLLANPNDASRSYHGVQLIATRRFANRYQYQVSYAWSRATGTVGNEYHTNATYWSLSPLGSIGSNPNMARYAEGRPKYDYREFKALGSYRAPWLGGFTAAGVFRWHTGVRWQRSVVQFTPFFSVYPAEPAGTRQAPDVGALDLRIEKGVPLGRAGTLGLYLDVFNVTNIGRATDYVAESGPSFGYVSGWTEPRTARVGLRWEF